MYLFWKNFGIVVPVRTELRGCCNIKIIVFFRRRSATSPQWGRSLRVAKSEYTYLSGSDFSVPGLSKYEKKPIELLRKLIKNAEVLPNTGPFHSATYCSRQVHRASSVKFSWVPPDIRFAGGWWGPCRVDQRVERDLLPIDEVIDDHQVLFWLSSVFKFWGDRKATLHSRFYRRIFQRKRFASFCRPFSWKKRIGCYPFHDVSFLRPGQSCRSRIDLTTLFLSYTWYLRKYFSKNLVTNLRHHCRVPDAREFLQE